MIVSTSVPQALTEVKTNVFNPGTSVTLFWKALVALLKLKFVTETLFCFNVIPCPLLEFKINALKLKLGDVTVVPFDVGVRTVITGAMQF